MWKDGEYWRKYVSSYARLICIKLQLHAGKKSNEELMVENLAPPTDEFIESVAQKYGMTYTKGKKGEDGFYSNNEPIYSLNDGKVSFTRGVYK